MPTPEARQPTPEARQVYVRYLVIVVIVLGFQAFSGWLSSKPALEIAKETNSELIEAERQNAVMHARSIDDRTTIKSAQATIKDIQDANIQRIKALETEVAELKAELKTLRGDR